jgi:C1A family cysteine protease
MRVSAAVLVFVGSVASVLAQIDKDTLDYEFSKFIAVYGRSYRTKDEYMLRRVNFEA